MGAVIVGELVCTVATTKRTHVGHLHMRLEGSRDAFTTALPSELHIYVYYKIYVPQRKKCVKLSLNCKSLLVGYIVFGLIGI